jgi:hypothetical protein
MPADAAALEELAKLLLRRADDLYTVGRVLTENADAADWQCAKADRYREAMRARRTETTRLSGELVDLGRWLRMRAHAAAAAPQP